MPASFCTGRGAGRRPMSSMLLPLQPIGQHGFRTSWIKLLVANENPQIPGKRTNTPNESVHHRLAFPRSDLEASSAPAQSRCHDRCVFWIEERIAGHTSSRILAAVPASHGGAADTDQTHESRSRGVRDRHAEHVFRGVDNRACRMRGAGFATDRQTTGFLSAAGSQKHRELIPQAPGVERMRSTADHGWTPRACAKQDSAAQWVYAGPEYVIFKQSSYSRSPDPTFTGCPHKDSTRSTCPAARRHLPRATDALVPSVRCQTDGARAARQSGR